MIKTCESCKAEFKGKPRNKYCSRECMAEKFRTIQPITCLHCSKSFLTPSYKTQKYCSAKCMGKHKENKVEKNCVNCDKAFSVRQALKDAKFCSHKCYSSKKKKQETLICAECHIAYSVHKKKASYSKFCSRKCYLLLNAKKNRLICAYCEKPFPKRHAQSKFCSRKCSSYSRAARKLSLECCFCKKHYEVKAYEKDRKFCSRKCGVAGVTRIRVIRRNNKIIQTNSGLAIKCSACFEEKPLIMFSKTSQKKAASKILCKDCITAKRYSNLSFKPPKDDIETAYLTQNKTMAEIAQIYEVGKNTVINWLRHYDLKKGGRIVPPLKAELEQLYRTERLTKREIAEIYNMSGATLGRIFKRYEIDSMPHQWGLGRLRKCKDGHIVRSSYEVAVDNWLTRNQIAHEYEPQLPQARRYRSDFYANGFYIEVWGLEKDETYLRRKNFKRKIYQKYNLPLIEIDAKDFEKKSKYMWIKKLLKLL